jgi:BioD-like phosphotransacetylase family protein
MAIGIANNVGILSALKLLACTASLNFGEVNSVKIWYTVENVFTVVLKLAGRTMESKTQRRLFVAATNQNDGKTTCSLGFIKGFTEQGISVGFIKPVGQRYVTVNGDVVDEDALLIQRICNLDYPLRDLNPVPITSKFTRQYLDAPEEFYPELKKAILDSFEVIGQGKDLVVVEGSGHAGVGSVFDMSNAHVAKLLNAKAVIVTLGGIGRPIDEVAVNRSLFEKEGVPVVGVVVNKVIPEKLQQTKYYLTKSLERSGLKLLGVIPYMPRLSWPTVQEVADAIQAKVINGHDHLENGIAEIVIGAMTAYNALQYVCDKALLIVPGDRDDIISAAVTMDLLRKDISLAGIVLTGGLKPQASTLDLISNTDIPVLLTDARTYEASSAIHDVTAKIHATDKEKTQLAAKLVCEHVDLETLWNSL